MQYDLSSIMKRAWSIKRKNVLNIFGLCLRMSWCEAKKILKSIKLKELLDKFCIDHKISGFRKNLTVRKMIDKISDQGLSLPQDIMLLFN